MTSLNEVGLRQLRKGELYSLKERLARHLPHSLPVYCSVSLALRYGLHSLRPAIILVPTNPHPSCFTVIAPLTSGGQQSIEVFWSLEEHTPRDVADHLSCIPDLDWNEPLQSLGSVGGQRVRFKTMYQGCLYSLQEPAILDIELPSMYHVTCLKKEDASVLWTHWKFSSLYSEEVIMQTITHFPSVGIRERVHTDNAGLLQEVVKDTLVSWGRLCKLGGICNTITLPQHRRRGLASVATLTLARQLLQEGFPVYVSIENDNNVSIKFHERLGFKCQCAQSTVMLMPA